MSLKRKVYFDYATKNDVDCIYNLVLDCFDRFVSRFYDNKVLTGLKSLYSSDKIEEIINSDYYDVFIARKNNQFGKADWVMGLHDSLTDDGIELKMFYGTSAYSCKKSLYLAKDIVLERNRTYLYGDVLESAWHTFEKCGCVGLLKVSEAFEKTEKNSFSGEDFNIRVRNFKFKPMEILLFENSCELV